MKGKTPNAKNGPNPCCERRCGGFTARSPDAGRPRGAGASFHHSNDEHTAVICRRSFITREILGSYDRLADSKRVPAIAESHPHVSR
ncbi:hypothetical protein EIB72_07785 [Burkholderia ambifaria]|uniref:hypothetical protein n=1 Tax=Burkholderia ambifaria TaxID=152480 RepID=UPI0013FDCADB|nr:hypothetical protein [Burkholderia ambifaria]NHL66283.1 hypothetical protein [Burkholderia ambifaria]